MKLLAYPLQGKQANQTANFATLANKKAIAGFKELSLLNLIELSQFRHQQRC